MPIDDLIVAKNARMTPESHEIRWILESDDSGQWALYLHAGGTVVQMTPAYPSRDACIDAIKAVLQNARTTYG